jgi:hypothetical protein
MLLLFLIRLSPVLDPRLAYLCGLLSAGLSHYGLLRALSLGLGIEKILCMSVRTTLGKKNVQWTKMLIRFVC